MGAKTVTKLFADLISSTASSNSVLSEIDYFRMASGDPDYNKLKERGVSSAEIFKDIAAYFKANTGRTVERNDELFERAAEEMREFIIALSSAKIKLLFAHISEPQGVAKPAYFAQRPNYNKTQYSRGSSSKASVQTPGKRQSIGFGDDDAPTEDPARESVEGSVGTASTSKNLSVPHTPQTPTPARRSYAKSTTERSSVTRRTVSIGFADDDEDDEPVKSHSSKSDSIKPESSTDFDVNISESELRDLALVSDFIDPSNEGYNVEPVVLEFVQEAIRTKRAMSEIARDVVIIIRATHSNSQHRSIENALGYEDEIVDMDSAIVKWVLTNAPQ